MSDTTPEALAAVLLADPRGVILLRDELAAWLGGFGRYTGGTAGERALWLEAYGARSHTIDRVKTGATRIERLAVSIVGSATPDRLVALAMDENDGLAARFLWSWPEPRPPIIPNACADVAELERALAWLRELPMSDDAPALLSLDPDAVGLFQAWRLEHTEATGAASGILASCLGKAPGMVLRLALVLEEIAAAGQPVAAPRTVSADSIVRAIALWDAFFRPMAERVLGDASLPQADRDASTLARWIACERPTVVNARELRRGVRLPGLTEAGRVKSALESLVEASWLEPAPTRAGDTRGRPRSDYRVRPELYASLDARAGARP